MGLLNVDGYYNSLLSFIDKAVEEGFISPSARQIIVSAPTPKELVKKLEVPKCVILLFINSCNLLLSYRLESLKMLCLFPLSIVREMNYNIASFIFQFFELRIFCFIVTCLLIVQR